MRQKLICRHRLKLPLYCTRAVCWNLIDWGRKEEEEEDPTDVRRQLYLFFNHFIIFSYFWILNPLHNCVKSINSTLLWQEIFFTKAFGWEGGGGGGPLSPLSQNTWLAVAIPTARKNNFAEDGGRVEFANLTFLRKVWHMYVSLWRQCRAFKLFNFQPLWRNPNSAVFPRKCRGEAECRLWCCLRKRWRMRGMGGGVDDDRKTDSTCTNPYVINWKKARISPGCKIASVGQLQSQHRAFFKSKKKNKATLSLWIESFRGLISMTKKLLFNWAKERDSQKKCKVSICLYCSCSSRSCE